MWGYFMIYSEISTNNNMIWFCLTMAEFTRLHSVEIIILVAANMKIDDIGAHTFRQTRIQIELLGPPAGCTSLRCNAPHLLQPGDGNESVTGTVGFT